MTPFLTLCSSRLCPVCELLCCMPVDVVAHSAPGDIQIPWRAFIKPCCRGPSEQVSEESELRTTDLVFSPGRKCPSSRSQPGFPRWALSCLLSSLMQRLNHPSFSSSSFLPPRFSFLPCQTAHFFTPRVFIGKVNSRTSLPPPTPARTPGCVGSCRHSTQLSNTVDRAYEGYTRKIQGH